MSDDLFTEAAEIVAAVAGADPIATMGGMYDPEGTYDECKFCEADDIGEGDGRLSAPLIHEPDCVWIRARRLTQLPVHPHRVR